MRTSPSVEGPSVEGPSPTRRVRDQAREAVVLMAFSAATSGGLALGLLLLTRLGR